MEQRLIELETKLAFQESALQELNDLVYQQSQRLDKLEALFDRVAERLREVSEHIRPESPANERPPHY